MYRTKGESTKKNVKSVNESFFEKWSPDMAYVLGFFVADGCLAKNQKRRNYYIEFVSTDFDIIEKIKHKLNADQKIGARRGNGAWKKAYRLQIGSKRMFDSLINYGFSQNKSKILSPPDVPKEYFPDFLRGYFDGDGCISWGKYKPKNRPSAREYIGLCFTSGSKNFLLGIKETLVCNKISKNGYLIVKNGGYSLSFTTLDTLRILRYIYQRQNSIHLDRKYEKSMALLSKRGTVAQR